MSKNLVLKNWYFITTMVLLSANLLISCSQPSSSNASGNMANGVPEISFENRTHEFGDIMQGEKVSFTFVDKNTGTAPLIVKSVRASCGCTTPKYSKEPIEPGKEGFVEVVFDSSGRQGFQTKSVTLETNCPEEVTDLNFTANIKLNNQ